VLVEAGLDQAVGNPQQQQQLQQPSSPASSTDAVFRAQYLTLTFDSPFPVLFEIFVTVST
jgi:hypothetical protein